MSLNASNEVMRRRYQKTRSRLPPNYDPRILFATPGAGPSNPPDANPFMTSGAGGLAQRREMPPPHMSTEPSRYVPILPGHFSNPMENLIAASARLAALPVDGDDPTAVETRRIRELVHTALAQQETYYYNRDRFHSAPPPWMSPPHQDRSQSYSRHIGSEVLSRDIQRRDQRGGYNPVQDRVRPEKERAEYPKPCLVPALRNVRLPKDFK